MPWPRASPDRWNPRFRKERRRIKRPPPARRSPIWRNRPRPPTLSSSPIRICCWITNILDNLSGSSALISVRGRATFSRPFERVEALRRQADDRLRSKALELQAELQQTETKLTELQSKRNDQSSLALSPEQEAELKRFVAEKARVRKELRETQRGLDVDINRLNTWLKVVNIAIVPLFVAIAGAIVLSLRRRRRMSAAAMP
jgi:ABC-type uncharacterized transport system involved in gliding motility auxiliary subunit